jgi:HSP20 family molecular chaperone IbpA
MNYSPMDHLRGKVFLDESSRHMTYIVEMAGYKTENVTVKFDRVYKKVTVNGKSDSGLTDQKQICFTTEQLLQELCLSDSHFYEYITPLNFFIEDGVLTITFDYIKSELYEVPAKDVTV